MKTLPAILAVSLALVMALAPLTVFAAGTVTFTTPTSGSTVAGAYTISGTVSPAPTLPDQLFIKVTNPSNNVVDVADVSVTIGTGAFTYSTTTGSGSTWPSGTYTIAGTDSNGATGSSTFNFVASHQVSSGGLALQLWATASTPINGGSSAQVEALTEWNNGTFASSVTFKAIVITPNGQATQVTGSPTAVSGQTGAYWWTVPTTSSQTGLWVVILTATSGTYTVLTQTSFTVGDFASNSALSALTHSISTNLTGSVSAIQSSLTSIASGVTGLQSAVTGIQSSLGTMSTNIGTLQSGLTSLTTTVNSISSGVNGLTTSMSTLSTNVGQAVTAANSAASSASSAATAANNAKSAVDNTSTYVLVVAVIAAITLVLELAILVRKLS